MTYSIQKNKKSLNVRGLISRGIYREQVDVMLQAIVNRNTHQLHDLEIYVHETGECLNAEDWWQDRIL